tara:strand:- start:3694 stop:3960 length:267 start_codon:yes stop_codon:yes gene_type:complete
LSYNIGSCTDKERSMKDVPLPGGRVFIDYNLEISQQGFHWYEDGISRLYIKDSETLGLKPGDTFTLVYNEDDTLFLEKIFPKEVALEP